MGCEIVQMKAELYYTTRSYFKHSNRHRIFQRSILMRSNGIIIHYMLNPFFIFVSFYDDSIIKNITFIDRLIDINRFSISIFF